MHPGTFAVVGLALVAALGLAVWSWSSGRPTYQPTSTLLQVELHQLNDDQAACLRFGLIVRRSIARNVTADLGRYSTLDPHAARGLRLEVGAIDALGAAFPQADYHLIARFDDVADGGTAVLLRKDYATFRTAVSQRFGALAVAAQTCRQVAHFDSERLAPI